MQQNKNLMLFLLASFTILIGWVWVQNHFWPPKKPDDKLAKKEKAEPKEKPEPPSGVDRNALASLAAVFDAAAVHDVSPWQVALQLKLLQPLSERGQGLQQLEAWLPSYPEPKVLVLGVAEAVKVAVDKTASYQEPQVIVLGGGPRHHIEALLTTRGAGVQKLILNKYRAANYLGLPVPDKEVRLELIPEDPYQPSFLMFHYELVKDPENPGRSLEFDADARPVYTLGKLLWKLDTSVVPSGRQAMSVDTRGKVVHRPESKPASNSDEQQVRFWTEVPDTKIRIVKTYTLQPGAYHIDMSLKIEDTRETGEPVNFRYQLCGAHCIPVEGEWFAASPRSSVVGTVNSRKYLAREQEEAYRISFLGGGNKIPEDLAPESFIQYAGIMNQFFCSLIVVDDKQAKKTGDDKVPKRFLKWARPTLETSEAPAVLTNIDDDDTIQVDYSPEPKNIRRGVRLPILPQVRKHIKDANFEVNDKVIISYYTIPKGYAPDHKTVIGPHVVTWIRRGQTPRASLDDITVRVISQVLVLKPGEKFEHKSLLYNGPAKVKQLYDFSGAESVPVELCDKYTNALQLKTVTDFGRFWWWSDLIIACSNLMHFLLSHLRFLGDGFSIVLLTVLVRGLMFPVSRKQAIYSVKMQELAPEMKKIQEKFKSDPRARTEAIMEMYRKYNVHPLGGCLPILLQMPIFIGLYFALQESVHFRLASFLWIENLAAPDMLFWWSESIPVISDPNNQGGVVMDKGLFTWLVTLPRFLYLGPFFNLLPVIAVTFMIVQQKVMTPPPQDEQQAAQFRMMRYMMVVIGLMFYKVAAGLAMYIIISTVWGLAERRFLPKKQTALTEPPATPPPGGGGQRSGPGPSGRKQPPNKAPQKKDGKMQKVKDWWQEVLKQAKKK